MFTVALLLAGTAHALRIPWVGEHGVDPWLASTAGPNVSDVGYTVLVIAGCGVLTLVCTGAIAVDEQGRDKKWFRPTKWVIVSGTVAAVVAAVVLSRVGSLSRVPVDDVFVLSDPASRGFTVVYLFAVAVCSAALVAVFVVAVRDSGVVRMIAFGALAGVGLVGLSYSGWIAVSMWLNPGEVADLHARLLPWGGGLAMVGLAVAGAWAAWSRCLLKWFRLSHKRPTVRE